MASRLALSAARRQLFAGARQPAARAYSAEASTGNAFLEERRHIKEHAAKSTDLWRKVSMYVCIPGSIVLGVYIYQIEAAHIAHREHEIHENNGELPERTFYEYNNVRKKAFPWGQQSFFFNPKVNYPAEEM